MNIVAIFATDWGIYNDQVPRNSDFVVASGWIVGILLREDDDKVVVAHHLFTEGDVRHVSVIPKANIVERCDLALEEVAHAVTA